MAQVLIRNLPKKIVDRLKARARANGRSLEAELRLVLERAAEPTSVGEAGAVYGAARPETEDDPIRPAERPGAFADFEPLELSGTPLSEMIIEDRRRD